jgi:exopolysaccharide biosynthesis polyprenyl glycosylphosphotransferase
MAAVMLRRLTWNIAIFDALLLAITLAALYLLRFGSDDALFLNSEETGLLNLTLSPWQQALLMYAIWVLVLTANKSRDYRILGSDAQEYKRVAMSGFLVPVFFAFAALLFKVDVPRLYISVSVLLGTLVLLANRWAWRQWLTGQRSKGNYQSRVALLGPMDQIQNLARKLHKANTDGYVPAVLMPDSAPHTWASDGGSLKLPIVQFDSNFCKELAKYCCKALIVVGSQNLSEHDVKRIAWQLEGTGVDLVVAAPLKDIATTRLQVRPVAGTPVFLVEVPKFSGWKHLAKDAFDVLFASSALILLSPLFIGVATLIKLGDGGPVFFSHERYGQNGKTFKMLKFRSMRVGSDKLFDELKANSLNDGNAVQFKLREDPRITPLGRVLRKYSIDELPQFINVLKGEMSVVGPRPHVQQEINAYDEVALRRLLVKPGLTGLWQVSGRSNLNWEESVALDLDYVENWSILGDVLLIMRTVREVAFPSAAY